MTSIRTRCGRVLPVLRDRFAAIRSHNDLVALISHQGLKNHPVAVAVVGNKNA